MPGFCEGLRALVLEGVRCARAIASDSYGEMIEYRGNKDVTTRRMREAILAKDEEHADNLSDMQTSFKSN